MSQKTAETPKAAAIQTIITSGLSGSIVEVECRLSNNLPNIIIVGYANKSVIEAKERIRGAFASSHIMLPRKRITINLAPADLPKDDSGFDLAIAVAVLLASQQIPNELFAQQAFIGELGLAGDIRPVRGIIGKVLVGRGRGIKTFFIPAGNLAQARLIPKVTLVPVKTLRELYLHLIKAAALKMINTGSGQYRPERAGAPHKSGKTPGFSEVVGQDRAKRALEIAATGGHNVLFQGPPGTGKSMLAKALASVMPPLSREEVLEVTHLHSLAGYNYERIITSRPFRAPHHSASYVAVTGGGINLRPGEISLAHRGVLFFDELPEFSRLTLEALRQPLEDRLISIARARDTVLYPASFILVATANPCPCGYYGAPGGKCKCSKAKRQAYAQKLSGPILDRIDLYAEVHEVHHDKLLNTGVDTRSDDEIRVRIARARQRQRKRFSQPGLLNADMSNQGVKQFSQLTPAAKALLNTAGRNLKLSARAYMRCVKVARTIADLAASEPITAAHIQEALAYRPANGQV